MRTRIASIALGLLLVAQSAYSGDVAYQVDANRLLPPEPTKTGEPAQLTIVDREWAIPGIEQTNGTLPPPREFDFLAPPPKLDDVYRGGRKFWPHATTWGPRWLDNVAWPRTRAMFGTYKMGTSFDKHICQDHVVTDVIYVH